MSLSTVNVVVTVDSAAGVTPEGNVIAVPSGTEWPDGSNNPIVPPVVRGTLASGTVTLVLVASDNFAAGVLKWDFIINVRGLPTVNVAAVPVNFATGASQNVWTILASAGWVPISSP